MSHRCSAPAQPGDTRYVYAEHCTWHGPIALAGTAKYRVDVTSTASEQREYWVTEAPCCPRCKDTLCELSSEDDFWAMVRNQERELPGYEAMLRFGAARCYPDFDTLQNAWRQAIEGY